jgi:hypothetical protein
MRFKIWFENEDDDQKAAELYFSIGHGDYSDELGADPDYIVWALINGKIETSKKIKSGGKIDATHGTIWGHQVTDNTFKGRYEPQTGRLSIVKPERLRIYGVHSTVMDLLRRKFKYITKVYEF